MIFMCHPATIKEPETSKAEMTQREITIPLSSKLQCYIIKIAVILPNQ